uniref:Ribosomal protein L6 n=1 Tax=Aphanomyces invadans TaxID=157072 RepID=A0A1I9Q6H6_9STRA|nr:ribosomal protein L6 [Aphanomyces invadans]AOQ30664.1 ribosomal protein L6 [Aphanomyces invadans]
MIKILKKKKKKQSIFLKSSLGYLNIFNIHTKIKIPTNIKIIKNKNILNLKGPLGKINLNIMNSIFIFLKNKNILLHFNNLFLRKKKKSFLNLYKSLIKLKIKGILQGFKLNLFLKGLGFKAFIEKNLLILKLGYSHSINITIPENIKIINQTNKLIFISNDWLFLTKYVHFIKSYKKPEPYKGKGLLLKNENIILKEGKKSKK